jgi:hypothetical protein
MQVLVKSTSENAQTRCSICGQGFALYWERRTQTEQAEMLKEVEAALISHHANDAGVTAHPDHSFVVPAWDGPASASGAAILGNAPTWAV